jgi:hypothetical protein
MTTYSLLYDDGAHTTHLEDFDTLEEANKVFFEEANKFKSDPAGYSQDDPDNWDEEFYPHIEITEYNDDDEIVETINCFSTLLGFDIEPEDA